MGPLVTAIMVLMILAPGLTGVLFLLNYREMPKRKPVDISEKETTPFEWVQPTVKTLTAQGFRRLGETQVRLPFSSKPGTAWIMVDAAGTTYVEVVGRRPQALATFITLFEDGAALESDWPSGENIETPGFYCQALEMAVDGAYREHLARLALFGKGHGPARTYQSMADYLAGSEEYRKRHIRRWMGRAFGLNLARVGALVYAVAVGVIFWRTQSWVNVSDEQLNQQFLGLFLSWGPAVVLPAVVGRVLEAGHIKRMLERRRSILSNRSN